MSSPWLLPRDVSLHGHLVDEQLERTTFLATVLFLSTLVLVSVILVRYRAPKKQANESLPGAAGFDAAPEWARDTRLMPPRSVFVRVGLAVLFVWLLLDVSLMLRSRSDVDGTLWNVAYASTRADVVRIEINAHQWAWDARYPGPDGQFDTPDDVVVLEDIRVPVGSPVVLQLASVDVVHSFYLPNFRLKQDVVPGTINRMWFQAKETGSFDIGCAQFCGVYHYKMRGTLTVVTRPEYDEWIRRRSAEGVRGFDPNDTAARWGWAWKR